MNPTTPKIPRKWSWHHAALTRLRDTLVAGSAERSTASRTAAERGGADLIDVANVESEHAALLAQLAQRQLDWILGLNPFDASTIVGYGRNHPALFVTSEFKPSTPVIAGGVLNGLGGTEADETTLEPGSYNTCEYWTPMVAYAMWMLSRQTL